MEIELRCVRMNDRDFFRLDIEPESFLCVIKVGEMFKLQPLKAFSGTRSRVNNAASKNFSVWSAAYERLHSLGIENPRLRMVFENTESRHGETS